MSTLSPEAEAPSIENDINTTQIDYGRFVNEALVAARRAQAHYQSRVRAGIIPIPLRPAAMMRRFYSIHVGGPDHTGKLNSVFDLLQAGDWMVFYNQASLRMFTDALLTRGDKLPEGVTLLSGRDFSIQIDQDNKVLEEKKSLDYSDNQYVKSAPARVFVMDADYYHERWKSNLDVRVWAAAQTALPQLIFFH